MRTTLARDGLTQALTRQAGEELLQKHLRRATPQHPLALLFFDLDHFKSINDAFGHAVGDAVLREMVAYLQGALPEEGAVVRYGGDEFFVLLPDTNREQARAWAQRVLDHLSSHPLVPGHESLYIRLSIGVAVAPAEGRTPEALLKAADHRHYFAKYSGGHRVALRDRGATQSLIARPRRPIGQRRERNRLHQLILSLARHPTGVIRIQSPLYGGASSFLTTAQEAARLQGYALLELSLTPALQWRYLGAFHHALTVAGLAEAVETEADALRAIGRLAARSERGVLLTVSYAEWLDEGSLGLIQRLLGEPPGGKTFVLVYATTLANFVPDFRASLFERILLPPLQADEVRAWIRHALRWEPPQVCVDWILRATEGLPDLIPPTLEALVQEGYLQPLPEGWRWFTPAQWRPPRPEPPALQHTGVPAELPLLFGRNRDLDTLQGLVRRHALTTVVGPAGIGKSRLLQQLTLESVAAFAEGARYVGPYGGIGSVAELVARGLEIPLDLRHSPLEQVLRALRSRHVLLVLDELERYADFRDFIQAVLREAPQVHLVVGARQPLQHLRERVYRLKGLSWEGGSDAPAVRLFFHRAWHSGATFPPTTETAKHGVEVCRWAQGNPLALRIMASWAATWPLPLLLERLQHSTEGNPLKAVLTEFWEMLSSSEQESLTALAVFQGPFDAAAAHAVAGASPFFLDALAAKAHLQRLAQQRFHLPGALRLFALERFARMPPRWRAQVKSRHARWYLERLPRHRGAISPDLLEEYLAPAEELPDVLAAWRWALQTRSWPLLRDAAIWVFHSLGDRNRFVQAYQLAEETLAVLVRVRPRERTEAYYALRAQVEMVRGEFKHHLGDSVQTIRWLQRVRSRLGPYLSPLLRAYLARAMGRCYMNLGQYPQAGVELQRALAYYRTANSTRGLLEVLRATAVMWFYQGELDKAKEYANEALEVAQRAGNYTAAAALLNNLGFTMLEQGDLEQARETLCQALETLGDYDAPSLRASIYESRGRVELALGEYCQALEYLSQALRHALPVGALANALEALSTTARVWAAMGHLAEARGLAEALLAHEALVEFNRGELRRLLAELPPPTEGGEPTAWDAQDVRALVQRVRALNRRWCAAR